MKRGIPIILTVLGLLLGLGLLRLWLSASTTGGPLPTLQGEAALDHLKGQGLYGSLQEAVTAARYGYYQEPKRRGDWRAYNPAQRLSACLTPDGLQIVTGGDEGGSHRLGMKLRGAGYGERQMAAKAGRLTSIFAGGARAEIHHELPQAQSPNPQSAIIEWYHNTAAGLEQGFTIESAPGERRDGEWLRVALALEGELRAEAVEGGQAVEFRDGAGRPALRYDHLVVRDGAGRELEARMAASEEEGKVWLEVDDRDHRAFLIPFGIALKRVYIPFGIYCAVEAPISYWRADDPDLPCSRARQRERVHITAVLRRRRIVFSVMRVDSNVNNRDGEEA